MNVISNVNPLLITATLLGIFEVCFVFYLPLRIMFIFVLVTIFIDKSPIVLFGSYVRISQVLFLLFLVKFLVTMLMKNKPIIYKIPFWKSLLFWYASFFLAYGNVISFKDFYIILIGQMYLYLLFYFSYVYFYSLEKRIQISLIRKLIFGGMIVVILGVLEFPLINLGLMKGIYRGGIGFSSPSSFMKEPDWYGFLCMYLALIFCVYKIKNSNLMFKKNINDLFFYICLFGLAISLARAAWIGFVVGAFILFIFSDMKIKQRYLKSMMVILILVVVSFVSLQIMKPDVTEKLINRINPSTTLETDNGAADSRMGSIRMMLYYIDIHPWVGNGVGGMGYLSSDKNVTSKFVDGEMNSGRGNANLILSSLFDSGIIGTIGLLFFIISYIKELFRRYSKSEDVILLAFTISFIGQLVDFMFNNGIRYSFVWLIFALSLAYKWDEIDFSPDINTPA